MKCRWTSSLSPRGVNGSLFCCLLFSFRTRLRKRANQGGEHVKSAGPAKRPSPSICQRPHARPTTSNPAEAALARPRRRRRLSPWPPPRHLHAPKSQVGQPLRVLHETRISQENVRRLPPERHHSEAKTGYQQYWGYGCYYCCCCY